MFTKSLDDRIIKTRTEVSRTSLTLQQLTVVNCSLFKSIDRSIDRAYSRPIYTRSVSYLMILPQEHQVYSRIYVLYIVLESGEYSTAKYRPADWQNLFGLVFEKWLGTSLQFHQSLFSFHSKFELFNAPARLDFVLYLGRAYISPSHTRIHLSV